MKTFFIITSILMSILLFPLVSAQTSQSAWTSQSWTWENYKGVTQWLVDVTEDESGCGGSSSTDSKMVNIQHNQETADISDFAHGAMRGKFSGNTMSIPGKTIPDGSGSSKLSNFNLVFTPDCTGFRGQYRWDYQDSYQSCSGSTTLSGSRIDSRECPKAEEKRSQIAQARAATKDKEKIYQDILAKDPKNFWANWDMAELKKKQGMYDEYYKYVDSATSNKNIVRETREILKKDIAKSLHLSDFPTPGTSPILRVENGELDNLDAKFINKVSVPKTEDKEKWYMKLWAILYPDSYKAMTKSETAINEIVGVKMEN